MPLSPVDVFPGYTFANNSISIPLAALPNLEVSDVDPATGNAMEVLRQILDKMQAHCASLTPDARPKGATITKPNPTIAAGANVPPGTIRQGYTATFDLMPTALKPANSEK